MGGAKGGYEVALGAHTRHTRTRVNAELRDREGLAALRAGWSAAALLAGSLLTMSLSRHGKHEPLFWLGVRLGVPGTLESSPHEAPRTYCTSNPWTEALPRWRGLPVGSGGGMLSVASPFLASPWLPFPVWVVE